MEKKKIFSFKKLALGIALLFIVVQLFMIDKTNPIGHAEEDIIMANSAPEAVGIVLKTACYDCHSNNSNYPWYTNIAPVSWWIKHHINEGRAELNFSEWGTYTPEKADHKLEECIEQIGEGEMPLTSYTIIHKEANLSVEQKKILLDWFTSLRKLSR